MIGVVAFCCCGPAAAAPPYGHAILPGPVPSARELQRLGYPQTLVELDRVRGPTLAGTFRRAGGELISPALQVWRVPTPAARRLLPELTHRGLVRSAVPDRRLDADLWSALRPLADFTDPRSASEWWVRHVGANRWTPPGPGVPLTVIDSGVDVSHEEFRRRPNTLMLNRQILFNDETELHGTAVSSVAAAPKNGVGIVGVYPRARLRSFDISPQGIPTITDELKALAAVAAGGRGVVNISFGGATYFAIEEHAILSAFNAGSVIVAAAGNFRELVSPLEYPANFAHVLTVAATDQQDDVTVFSSATPAVDLAAPGLDIPAAAPRRFVPGGYTVASGTSFSVPIVAGAAAGIWTKRPKLEKTQLLQVLRLSARDLGTRGRDPDTGLGMLNIPAALRRPAPRVDPQEPNEDVYLVKPNGISKNGHAPLTTPGRLRATIGARLDEAEDPADVYRVWLPAGGRLTLTARPTADVTMQAWGPAAKTVYADAAGQRRHLLGSTLVPGGTRGTLTLRGRAKGQFVFVDVYLRDDEIEGEVDQTIGTGAYTLRAESARP